MEENQGKPNKIVQFLEKVAETLFPPYKRMKELDKRMKELEKENRQLWAENKQWNDNYQAAREKQAKIDALHDKVDQRIWEEERGSPGVESELGPAPWRMEQILGSEETKAASKREKGDAKQGSNTSKSR